uniref:Uncharacterized protein n=1 Tax=Trichuris muris TaxID=70415 RepID=A0A5S6QDX6_TRIMR
MYNEGAALRCCWHLQRMDYRRRRFSLLGALLTAGNANTRNVVIVERKSAATNLPSSVLIARDCCCSVDQRPFAAGRHNAAIFSQLGAAWPAVLRSAHFESIAACHAEYDGSEAAAISAQSITQRRPPYAPPPAVGGCPPWPASDDHTGHVRPGESGLGGDPTAPEPSLRIFRPSALRLLLIVTPALLASAAERLSAGRRGDPRGAPFGVALRFRWAPRCRAPLPA